MDLGLELRIPYGAVWEYEWPSSSNTEIVVDTSVTEWNFDECLQVTYFFPFPLALKVFSGSIFPFLPLTTFLPFPLTILLVFGLSKLTKPMSCGFLPPGRR
jgi:hypothetical protein